mmetsp:Transcript_18550/g.25724  ORF Transcript_18550/g.25724 Transcript_18550/m.25724 type:complete len:203 (+) Transcript_18550:126-734(+)
MKFNNMHHALIFIFGSLLPQIDMAHAAFGIVPPTATTTTKQQCTVSTARTTLFQISRGPGWGNDDFLDSLGGNEAEKQNTEEKYQEYKNTREAFDERQLQRMNTPAGQKFMAEMSKRARPQQRPAEGDYAQDDDSMIADQYSEIGSVSGGSRLRDMMRRSKNTRRPQTQEIMGPEGFVQKFAPVEEDEEDDNKKDDDLTWSF